METYFYQRILGNFYSSLMHWIVTELPAIIILIIIFIVALRLSFYMINKLKKIVAKRTVNKTDEPDLEVEKRLNTLMGIVKNHCGIVLWSVFIMIFLKKINIDIAPLLAGAGIIGLAVGFGAQELVRDFITGFLSFSKTKSAPVMWQLLTEPAVLLRKLNCGQSLSAICRA